MNFLLHLRLNELAGLPAAGAIIGDVLRGRIEPSLPAPLARSIALHRRVDAVSDRHPALTAIKSAFVPETRRYAGILLDLLCDHVAANDWDRYGVAGEILEAFAHRMADAVDDAAAWRISVGQAPPEAPRFARLLASYREADGIDRAIEHISTRLREPAPFLEAAQSWRLKLDATASALPGVFDDLAAAARGFALID